MSLKQPRVAITGIGVVSAFGVGRDSVLGRHPQRPERHARHHRVRRLDLSLPGGRAGAARRHRVGDGARRRARPRETRADPKRYSRAALFGVLAAREAWNDAGPRVRRAERRRDHRQRRRRHRRRRAPVPGLLQERRPARHAVRDRGRHLRHGVERDLDRARPARHQPRAVDRLHELDRRDRLRGDAAAAGRVRRAAVGRHRRLRAARA